MSRRDLRSISAKCRLLMAGLLALSISLMPATSWSQTTVSQGSIQGTVTDQTNAVLPDATIRITSLSTGLRFFQAPQKNLSRGFAIFF